MSPRRPPERSTGLAAAFDELRFGAERTLNLRATFPTASEAAERTEKWLRERQAAKAGEVLVITGRGKGSEGGISVVREAVIKRLTSLRRRGVIDTVREHTLGSFVVTLAPLSRLLDAPRRKREPDPPPPDPRALEGLEPETRAQLRVLAERALDVLGVVERPDVLVRDEMVRQFERLAPAAGTEGDRERRLRAIIATAIDELDEI